MAHAFDLRRTSFSLMAVVLPALASCGSTQHDVGYLGGGGAGSSQGGAPSGGAAAGSQASSGSVSGGHVGAGGSTVEQAGGGAAGSAETAGEAGQGGGAPPVGGASTAGGAGSLTCDIGCVQLCEGGAGCMCSCPTTSLTCVGASTEYNFPSRCTVDADCFVAEHYTGCCRVQATGLSVEAQTTFETFESSVCNGPPVCGCAVDQLTTDDGQVIQRNKSYAVKCMMGACKSFVP
jgi:hypothetical protein